MRYLQKSKGDSALSEYEIVIEAEAKDDIVQIFEYICNTLMEHNTASRIYLNIYKSISSLGIFPERCAVIRKEPWHSKGMRRLISGNYLIFYYIDKKAHIIHILRVLYSKRNWENIL